MSDVRETAFAFLGNLLQGRFIGALSKIFIRLANEVGEEGGTEN